MKRNVLFLFFGCITTILQAQSNIQYLGQNNGERIRFELSNFNWTAGQGEEQRLECKDLNPLLEQGSPEVLYGSTSIIIDDLHQTEIIVDHASFYELDNIQLAASKGNLSRTIDPSTLRALHGEVYGTNAFFPGSLAKTSSPYIFGDFRGQNIHFYPFQYNPVTHKMRVYTEIEIIVVTSEQMGENPFVTSHLSTNTLRKEMYQKQFINYSAHGDRYNVVDEIGNMLVITHGSYIGALQPWIQWKIEKGIDVRVVDVAEVPTVAAMDSYIANYYNTGGNDFTYLVLVGDEDQVPSELVTNPNGTGYCDNCFGYISGNDHYPEIFVGRLLVHNTNELNGVISKIMEYEKYPNTDSDWFSTAMGIGSNEGAGIGDDNQADWQHQNGLKEDLLGFTYDFVYEKYDGNHTANSPTGGTTADGSGNATATELTNVINGGCSLINYTGHGDHSLIVTGSYTNAQINQLTNYHKFPYFIIVGCCVGDFDDDSGTGDTFGEAWLKSPNPSTPTGGIGGAFSTVFQSWAPPMEGQDEMNAVIAEISGTVTSTRHTLGSIHVHGCAGMNDVYGGDGDDMTDTWILMGDPSIQLRTDFPTQIEAQHAATIFLGMSSFTVTSVSENALVSLTIGNTIVATGIIQGGTCTLNFSAINNPGTMLVTLTNFNTIPYQQTVEIIPAAGPYVVLNNHVNHDSNGINTNNNAVDFGEQINLDINLSNVGVEVSGNTSITLSCDNSNITITDNSANSNGINVNQNLDINSAFSYNVSGNIADQTVVTFTVTITDDAGNTWTSTFTETINAPVLSCGEFVINDNGNGDGYLQTGETATLSYTIINTGHAASNPGNFSIGDNSNSTSLTTENATMTSIPVDGLYTFSTDIAVGGTAGTTENVTFNFSAVSGLLGIDCSANTIINQIIETWESGNDQTFNWQYEGNVDWFVSTNSPYAGTYCMESGNINNSQSTTLMLVSDFASAGPVGFMYKTSTEGSYDFLTFKVDNAVINSWSGENAWANYSTNVTAGSHTLRWIYAKDNIVSSGSDAAWVDNIILPPSQTTFILEENTQNQDIQLYPNPTLGNCFIEWKSMGQAQLRIIDIQGKTAATIYSNEHFGMVRTEIPSSLLAPGTYWIEVNNCYNISRKKLIVQ